MEKNRLKTELGPNSTNSSEEASRLALDSIRIAQERVRPFYEALDAEAKARRNRPNLLRIAIDSYVDQARARERGSPDTQGVGYNKGNHDKTNDSDRTSGQ